MDQKMFNCLLDIEAQVTELKTAELITDYVDMMLFDGPKIDIDGAQRLLGLARNVVGGIRDKILLSLEEIKKAE